MISSFILKLLPQIVFDLESLTGNQAFFPSYFPYDFDNSSSLVAGHTLATKKSPTLVAMF
jgi:hypothetical protein